MTVRATAVPTPPRLNLKVLRLSSRQRPGPTGTAGHTQQHEVTHSVSGPATWARRLLDIMRAHLTSCARKVLNTQQGQEWGQSHSTCNISHTPPPHYHTNDQHT